MTARFTRARRFVFRVIMISLTFFVQINCSYSDELWASVPDPQTRAAQNWPMSNYMDLFSERSAWSTSASHVKVFGLTARFILFSSDEELSVVIRGLNSRGISISVQGDVLTFSDLCGRHIEGYGGPNELIKIGQRLKNAGANIKYIDMDEPLYFGHQFKGVEGKKSCNKSIDELAEEAAQKLNGIFAIYPNAEMVDTEPYGGGSFGSGWISDVTHWHESLQKAMHRKITAFVIDVIWSDPGSLADLPDAISAFGEAGIPIGVVYHGLRTATSDHEWSTKVLEEANLLEGKYGVRPNIVVLESWMDRPRIIVPENAAYSFTNTLTQYLSFRNVAGRPVPAHDCEGCK